MGVGLFIDGFHSIFRRRNWRAKGSCDVDVETNLTLLFLGSQFSGRLSMENGGERIPDCTSCKLIGAGGCFAGAVYAVYERSKLPSTNKNRHWLTVIGVGRSMVWPEYKDCIICGLTNCDKGVMGSSVLMVIVGLCYQEVMLLYVILYGTLRNMRMHVHHTFSMELEMMSWAYKTAKTTATTST